MCVREREKERVRESRKGGGVCKGKLSDKEKCNKFFLSAIYLWSVETSYGQPLKRNL